MDSPQRFSVAIDTAQTTIQYYHIIWIYVDLQIKFLTSMIMPPELSSTRHPPHWSCSHLPLEEPATGSIKPDNVATCCVYELPRRAAHLDQKDCYYRWPQVYAYLRESWEGAVKTTQWFVTLQVSLFIYILEYSHPAGLPVYIHFRIQSPCRSPCLYTF